MLEVISVFIIFAIVAAIGVRAMGETLQHDRPGKAAQLFAADVEAAFSAAARQRVPIRIHADSANRIYHIEDRTDTTLKFKSRDLSTGDRQVGFIQFSPTSVSVMPSGIASAPFTAKFGFVGAKGTVTYTVSVTRTGLVTVNGR
jgi:Tfp pilus assembly protein FimT